MAGKVLRPGGLSDWQGNYGTGQLSVVSGPLSAREESPSPNLSPENRGEGLILGSRLRGNDVDDNRYVEEVDRALEQLAAVPSGVRSFGEMVARRGKVKCTAGHAGD